MKNAFATQGKTVIPNQKDQAPLAPAGTKRREQKAKRADQLEEQVETVAAALDMEAVDVNKLDRDLEILSQIDGLQVSNQKLDRAYCWVQAKHPESNPGLEIEKKRIEGWKVVKGDPDDGGDSEGWEHAGPDGIRRLGDVILMWMPKSRKQLIDDHRALKVLDRSGKDVQALKEQVLKETKGAIRLVESGEMSQEQLSRLDRIATAKKMAGKEVDKRVREGTMPGTRFSSAAASSR